MSDEEQQEPENQDDLEQLDQSAIDDVLASVAEESRSTIYNYNGDRFEKPEEVRIDTYDFRDPIYLSEVDMRKVRVRHEQFISHMEARLSIYLRMDVSLKLEDLITIPYQKFTAGLAVPSYLVIFKINQLTGAGVMGINPRLGLTMIDRQLGGKGHSVKEERPLTELEMTLVDDILGLILEEWCGQWADFAKLDYTLVGRESNGRFLQSSSKDAIVLVSRIEASMGDCTAHIDLALPYYTVEPLIKKVKESEKRINHSNGDVPEEKHWRNTYNEISVPVSAEWDAFEISVQDLLSLRPGDVLEMADGIEENTYVRFRGSTRFVGVVGLESENVVVKLNQKIVEN